MIESERLRPDLRARADGRCECEAAHCAHHAAGVRCRNSLQGPWRVHRIRCDSGWSMRTTRALCQACHRNASP